MDPPVSASPRRARRRTGAAAATETTNGSLPGTDPRIGFARADAAAHEAQLPQLVTPEPPPLRRGVRASTEGLIIEAPPNPFRLHRPTRDRSDPRISMSFDSDDSGSEPDLSVLGMTRAGAGMGRQLAAAMAFDDDEILSQEQYEVEDTSIDDHVDEHEIAPLFDPAAVGLKEISNLGKFTVSSHKPGSGVDELRSDDLKLYWQSDGPQPHKLTAYFVKRVGIRDIRFFVDYNEDESYTPTKIIFKSGTSENNLVEFATMSLDNPVGWQQVPITGAGGEPDGNTLISYVLQMQILENHQNGKDTHLRGIKIYALDADAVVQGPDFESRSQPLEGSDWASMADDVADAREAGGRIRGAAERDGLGAAARSLIAARVESGEAGFAIPDFMREPEIR